MNGVWASDGYGWILDLGESSYVLSHVTALDCVDAERGSLAEFRASYDRIDRQGDRLCLHQAGDLTRYCFRRLERFPDAPRFAPGGERDAVVNFETLWRQFEEHYAFFDLHGVDWEHSYQRFRPRVRAGMADVELFGVVSEMLEPLDDGHVSLSGAGLSWQRVRAQPAREAMRAMLGTPNGRITPRATVDAFAARGEKLLLAPFDATRTPLKRAANDLLAWCALAPGIGYLQVLRLFGFADTEAAKRADDLPRQRIDLGGFLRADIAALDAALDRMFAELAHCRALVVDLRFNGGGFDRAGLVIAGRFADRRRVAFSKCAVAGDGFTPEQAMEIEPAARPFTGPVVVLTSPLCVSAGEILVLALRALPQVTVMGQPTAGMLSDNLIKPLPNGWELSLSNEIYRSADGICFEGRGVAPAVAVTTLDAAALVPALHASLVAAVDLLQQAGVSSSPRRKPGSSVLSSRP